MDGITVWVHKETTESVNQQKPFKLPGFKLSSGICCPTYESGIQLTKQELLRIANAMDETDTLQISYEL